jgi:hypothetical protein
MSRPFIPVSSTVRAELRYVMANQQCENVIHCKGNLPADEDDLNLIGQTLVGWWINEMKGMTSNNTTLQGIKLTALDAADSPSIFYTTGCPVQGLNSSGTLPNNVSLAAKLGTAKRGRNFTGRWFMAGVPRNEVTDNSVSLTFQNALKTALENLITSLLAENWPLQIVSYIFNRTFRSQGVTTPVTSISVDPTIDSMRRRLPGRGR